MRKNLNRVRIEGYVYDSSKLEIREAGENAKNPGTIFINGELNIAVDEEGMNVIPVNFIYVTEFFKSGKKNNTFGILKQIIENPEQTWLASGKENATKVRVDAAIDLNDFIGRDDEMVSYPRVQGSFVNLVSSLADESERNTFQADMVITRVNRIEADPEKYINEDYVVVGGTIFNFRNDLLPIEFQVRNEAGMKFFENLPLEPSEPIYTKVWGRLNNEVIQIEREEESAFGEASVSTYERTNRQWLITGTSKVPYDFGDESVMTAEELTKAMQDRQTYLATVRQRHEEYQSSQNNAPAAKDDAVQPGGFVF